MGIGLDAKELRSNQLDIIVRGASGRRWNLALIYSARTTGQRTAISASVPSVAPDHRCHFEHDDAC